MSRSVPTDGLFSQLKRLLLIAGAHPIGWAVSTVVVSVVLAALDTLGIAAMMPLTQLITGADADSGVLAVIAGIAGTSDPTVLIPLVAATVAVLFIVKSLAAIAFRWWLLGRTTRVSADAATALLRGYVLAPYAAHRSRRLREIYRNITDAVTQATSVLMAVVSICTDLFVLAAITIVLAIASRWSRSSRSRVRHIRGGSATSDAPEAGAPGRGTRGGQSAVVAVPHAEPRRFPRGAPDVQGRRLRPWLSPCPSARCAQSGATSGSSPTFLATRSRSASSSRSRPFRCTCSRPVPRRRRSSCSASSRPLPCVHCPTLTRVAANLAIIRIGSVGLRIFLAASDELRRGGVHDETAPRFDAILGRYRHRRARVSVIRTLKPPC